MTCGTDGTDGLGAPMARTTATAVRRALGLVVVLVLTALSAACASIPTSGPVVEGAAEPAAPLPIFLSPNPPPDDASPEQIVSGFLSAQGAGTTSDYDVARAYLSSAASEWDPSVTVTVYEGDPGLEIAEEPVEGSATVTGTVSVVGTIDDRGIYSEVRDGTTADLSFGLEQDDEGRWRISDAEDGLLIQSGIFPILYQQTTLYFPTPDRRYFVPDERWFPKSPKWQTFAVSAVLAGPAPWLQDAVVNVAPPGTTLLLQTVPVSDGVATVNLSAAVQSASAEDRSLLQAQIQAVVVGSYPRTQLFESIRSVQLTSEGTAIDVDTVDPLPTATVVGDAVAVSGGELMSVDGSTLRAVDGAPSLAGTDPTAIAVDGDLAAGGSATVYVRDGDDFIVALGPDGAPESALFDGRDLVAPSVDRFGWVWSGPAEGTLSAVSGEGERAGIAAPWLDDVTLLAVEVAPDGARAVVVTSAPGGPQVRVTGIVRDESGRPTSLTTPVRIAPSVVDVLDVSWTDDTKVAVLGRSGGEDSAVVQLAVVGGQTTALSRVPETVALTAGNGERTILVLDDKGVLYGRSESATIWVPQASDVDLVTYPE
ncbi:hypothetical protein GCM10025865_22080 [Paraoerskovia sediminicola]|uniref:GerMN domain-containing protein n=1 Tax=Paraoerskovia sediminicola TaxID=1138587 RepID=A0ABM8G4D4_9CELL|nr:LpqB family beta-propeller domain-containing protein [Paraoerskovia sediminicola]BDZ42909.1 hypothetical protein GCM10025865_22080 [Paraoerskovia sediminicola]